MSSGYRFSFGPWNIHEGADPFGPMVRSTVDLADKFKVFKDHGFDAIMLHDDDIVPDIDSKSASQIEDEAKAYRQLLDDQGLVAEIVAPRLWEDARGIDGPLTSNDLAARQWGIDRAKRTADLGDILGTDLLVLWLAREGTYIRESKNALDSHRYLIDSLNAILEHHPKIRIAIEPKPNEPMDQMYIPTIGHVMGLAHETVDPSRVGGLIETAHSQLAGLCPADDMAYALSLNKLWGVHLNDQNGMKYDQDKSFAAANLRTGFNQIRVLEAAGYKDIGMVAFDVKAMRTQKGPATSHLPNSKRIFELLVERVRSFDQNAADQCIANRDYEALELMVMEHLLGAS